MEFVWKLLSCLMLLAAAFAISFFPVIAVWELVLKKTSKGLDEEIDKSKKEFERFGIDSVILSVKTKLIKHFSGSLLVLCVFLVSISFVIGFNFGEKEIQPEIKHLEEEIAEYEKALEDYYYEATSIIEDVHSEARSNLYSAEGEAWGADYTAEALRCGEVTYREVAEQYMKLSESVSDAVYYAEQKPPELENYLDVISRIKWG